MGNKIVSIVTVTATLLIFMLLVSFINYDMQVQRSQRLIDEITEQIQYCGYLSYDDYITLKRSIPFENSIIQITTIKKNKDGSEHIIYTPSIIGEERNDSTGQLESSIFDSNIRGTDGRYTFTVGDIVKIDLYSTHRSFIDAIASSLFGKSSSNIKLIASDAQVVSRVKS